MVEVKDVYQNFDGETIEEDIMKYYNGDLQDMLLALVKGMPLTFLTENSAGCLKIFSMSRHSCPH